MALHTHHWTANIRPIVRLTVYLPADELSDSITFSDEAIGHVMARISEEIAISGEVPARAGVQDMVLVFDGVNIFATIGQKTIHITDPRYFTRKNA